MPMRLYDRSRACQNLYTKGQPRDIADTSAGSIITAYDEFNKEEVLKLLKWADGVCIGSGIGRSTTSEKLLRTVIEYVDVPCLIDADGLNLLSDNKDLLDRLAGASGSQFLRSLCVQPRYGAAQTQTSGVTTQQ